MTIVDELHDFLVYNESTYTGKLSLAACLILISILHLVTWALHILVGILLTCGSERYSIYTKDPVAKNKAVMNYVCFITVLFLSPMYLLGALETNTSVTSRWEKPSYIGQLGIAFHVAENIYESINYLYQGKPIEFYLHHVVVIINFIPVLLSGHLGFFAYWDGTVEFTTIFLCIIDILKLHNFEKSIIYKLNGFCLWISFIVFRLIGMSYWLYSWTVEYFANKDIYSRNKCMAKPIAFSATVILLLLSCSWFSKITRGLLKALGMLKKETNKQK